MTQEFFKQQIGRLKLRFGARAFDPAIEELISREVDTMANEDFMRIIDFMIGSRPANKPPLIQDFRDARLNAEKHHLKKDVGAITKTMDQAWGGNLKQFLAKEYPGCKNITEAIEVQAEKNRIKRAWESE